MLVTSSGMFLLATCGMLISGLTTAINISLIKGVIQRDTVGTERLLRDSDNLRAAYDVRLTTNKSVTRVCTFPPVDIVLSLLTDLLFVRLLHPFYLSKTNRWTVISLLRDLGVAEDRAHPPRGFHLVTCCELCA